MTIINDNDVITNIIQSVSLCTKNQFYDKYGKFCSSKVPKKGQENIGVTYSFVYKSGSLQIEDGAGFSATLEVDSKKKFFPWVELYLKSVVLVQGQTKKIVVPEPAKAPEGEPLKKEDVMDIKEDKKPKK